MYMNKRKKCTAKQNIFHMLWCHLAKFHACTCGLKLRIPSWHAPPGQTFFWSFPFCPHVNCSTLFLTEWDLWRGFHQIQRPLSYYKPRLWSWSTVSDILLHHFTIFIVHLSCRTCTTVSDHGLSSFHSFTTVTLHVLGYMSYKCYRITGWWTHFLTTVCSLHTVLTHTGVFHHLRASDTHTMSSWAEAKWQTTSAVLFCQSLPVDGRRVHHSFSSSALQYIIHQLQYIIPSVHQLFRTSFLQFISFSTSFTQFISSSVHHSFNSPAYVHHSFSPSALQYIIPPVHQLQYIIPLVHQLLSTSFLPSISSSVHQSTSLLQSVIPNDDGNCQLTQCSPNPC